jgi:hypothetical protein
MIKIAVFYHIYQWGPWEEIFNEHWDLLLKNNLLDVSDFVHFGINGNMEFNTGHPRVFGHINSNPEKEESDTLKALYTFCKTNSDYKVLYFHTKGVSNNTLQTKDWRNMMNYFCIEEWRKCVKLLDSYDAVGCNLQDYNDNGIYRPHFSGNFWWANANYINRLDSSWLDSTNRYFKEFWIGTGNGNLCEIYKSNVNHYIETYPREIYEDKFIVK